MAKRILVVDDEPDVLDALERAIRIAGLSVEKAASAQGALALCKDHAFDLIVIDFIMPGMTGLELLNKVRALHPTIRSIIVSGKVDPQLKEDEVETRIKVELEADAYFSKPVANDRLLETIERLLTLGKDQKWEDVAERVLNSEKTTAEIKKMERGLKSKKHRRKK
jgi:two-component system OmpR family response regulator